jgi:hypothetical protein
MSRILFPGRERDATHIKSRSEKSGFKEQLISELLSVASSILLPGGARRGGRSWSWSGMLSNPPQDAVDRRRAHR